jgi:hypothetical protein
MSRLQTGRRSVLAIPPIGAPESLSRAPLKGGACAIVDATGGSALMGM